jgi:CheY-like chemotaxis protein
LDAVLLDVTLPGTSSREVLEEARRIRPDLNVVVTSAYSKETVDASFSGLAVPQFIRKPFRISEIVQLLQRPLS